MAKKRFDNGVISLTVPEGWTVFPSTDGEGREDPNKIYISKNAVTPFDIFTKPGMTVSFFGEDICYLSPRMLYDDVRDIEDVTLGARRWNGFSCKSFGAPCIMLECVDGARAAQIMIFLENGGESISLEDDDVQEIIADIKM